jgi:hypothetical protein
MMRGPINKKLFRRSLWSSFSRLVGVGLGSGAGSIIHQMVGDGMQGWGLALFMAIGSFVLMLYAEYERERDFYR